MRASTTLLLVATLLGWGPRLGAQSLGEVAQQEATRRKAVKETGKVYTNKDLKAVSPAPTPPAAAAKDEKADAPGADHEARDAAKSGATGPSTSAARSTTEDRKTQAYWSGRMKELRAAIERDQILLDALQSRVNALATDIVNRDDPAQRATLVSERDRALGELDHLTKSLVSDKQAVVDFEEEGRRSGIPPGWLR